MMATTTKPLPPAPPTEAQIRLLLETSDAAVEEGILRLHARQTQDEQQAKDTKHRNQRGFSAAHARRGSKYAGWIIGMRRDRQARPGQGLQRSDHKVQARALILHYVRQLHEVAVAKWEAARPSASTVQAQFDAEDAADGLLIQQADRHDVERAADSKMRRDAAGVQNILPGTMITLDRDAACFPSLDANLRDVVHLKAGATGLVLAPTQLVPGMGTQVKVLFGTRVLWTTLSAVCAP